MKWRRHGFPWVLAATLVAAGLLFIGLTLRLPYPIKPLQEKPLPELQVTNPQVAANAALQERLQLLDPTPLFLPSVLSSSRLDYPRLESEPTGSVLQDFGAQLVVAEWRPGAGGLTGPRAIPSPNDVVGPSEVRFPFFGLVREAGPTEPLPDRWAVADIFSAKTNVRIAQLALPAPKPSDFTASLWSPVELLMVVVADGVIGDPELTASSGILEVDDYVVYTMKSVYRMGGGLRPGIYRLVVGQ